MFFLTSLFTTFIYQPFFNLLVAVYLGLNSITGGNADMGIAVVIFTVVFRILWLPISLASGRSYKEKVEIAKKAKLLEEEYKHDPIKSKQAFKKLFRGNRRIVIASTINIFLQVLIALMLWRIFAKGLEGEDWHLLYPFMPKLNEPFNLTFLGKFDLSRPNILLNIIQSLVIFIFEALSSLFSTESQYRREMVMAQFVLPVVSFIIFAFMPAGKKLFIIVTLIFSIVQMLIRQLYFLFLRIGDKLKPKEIDKDKREQKSENKTDEIEEIKESKSKNIN